MIVSAPHRHGAALFWVMAIACFLAATGAIVARVSERWAEERNASLRGAFQVRVVAPDSSEAVAAAAADLRAMPGIVSAKPMTPERAASLLRDLPGPGLSAADLGPLRVIEVQTDAKHAVATFPRELEHALEAKGYQAEAFGPGRWAETTARAAIRFRDMNLALAAAFGIAALITAALVGRARAAGDRALVAPLADLGATRYQATAPFAARAATEGFMAGLLGAAVALAVSVWVLEQFLPNIAITDWNRLFAAEDAAAVIAAPLLAALFAAAGARGAASRAFSQAAKRA